MSDERFEVVVPQELGSQRARVLLARCEVVSPWVAELLQVPERDRVLVVVKTEEFLFEDGAFGLFHPGPPPTIWLGTTCVTDLRRLDSRLGHELAHASFMGSGAPYLLEEAIAQYVEGRLLPPGFEASVLDPVEPAELTPELLESTFAEVRGLPMQQRLAFFRLGRDLVEAIGFEALMEQLRRGGPTIDAMRAALQRGAQPLRAIE